MATHGAADQALGRLQAALARLEGAVERSLDNQRQVASLEGELQRLGTDRSRLAQSLDAAEERSGRIEDANREVSRRLVTAMESIREVLARNGAA
jgi:predicted  nucleic acid-binding Zn-ribbon protein